MSNKLHFNSQSKHDKFKIDSLNDNLTWVKLGNDLAGGLAGNHLFQIQCREQIHAELLWRERLVLRGVDLCLGESSTGTLNQRHTGGACGLRGCCKERE